MCVRVCRVRLLFLCPTWKRPRGVTVSTLGSEPSDHGSNPREVSAATPSGICTYSCCCCCWKAWVGVFEAVLGIITVNIDSATAVQTRTGFPLRID